MPDKIELRHKGEQITAEPKGKYWEVEFRHGPKQKLYHHVNAQKHAVWMWESGKIDEDSLEIGKLIERESPGKKR